MSENGRKDIMKVTAAFRNFAKSAPKKRQRYTPDLQLARRTS